MKTIIGTTDLIPESRFDLDSVLFFDIESTGLSKENSHVYLIGCAYREGDVWMIRQYLAEHISEEGQLVRAFYEFARAFRTLVHFNGDSFDVPYMDFKAYTYGIPFRLEEMDNYDILKKLRTARCFLPLKKMSQKSVEAFLKIKRDDEMSGGELIPFYFQYQQSGEERLEKYLLLHNYDDIRGMLAISSSVAYADIREGRFQICRIEHSSDHVLIEMLLDKPVPRDFEKNGDGFLLAAGDRIMHLVLYSICGDACFFFADYQNYYYLPEEDRAIHKDLAMFVDKKRRVKATKKTCYVKKTSVFLPQQGHLFEPGFYFPEKGKQAFFEAEQLDSAEPDRLKQYVMEFLLK